MFAEKQRVDACSEVAALCDVQFIRFLLAFVD